MDTPQPNCHCHSPSASFLYIFEDEFEGNGGNLGGNGWEVKKNVEEISWGEPRTEVLQHKGLSSSVNSQAHDSLQKVVDNSFSLSGPRFLIL